MAVSYDNDALVTSIKIKGSIADGRYDDQELLDLAYYQMLTVLYPMIISQREEYFVRHAQTAVVASQKAYPIFERALGLTVREVKLIVGSDIIDLRRIDPQDVTSTAEGEPGCFYFEGNDIVLYPTPATATGTIDQTYYASPGRLVPVSEVAQILTIDTLTNTVTISALPTGWTTANTFDFQRQKGGREYVGIDYSASAVSTSLIFTTALPTKLAVGDYVTLAGEAGFPQLPEQTWPLLVQSTATVAIGAQGHADGEARSQEREKIYGSGAMTLMQNRAQGAPRRFRTTLI